MPQEFWLVFLANLPIVAAILWALQKKWIIMGANHSEQIEALQERLRAKESNYREQLLEKDKEIAFREALRQETLADKNALTKVNQETIASITELRNIVSQTLELNDRLLSENLSQRWDGRHDRRTPKT